MSKRRLKPRTNRIIVLLLAFLLPGAGHLYLGQFPKGLLLFAALLVDIAAIVYLGDVGSGRHLLLIVYLIIALPCIYFFSVYDSLQLSEHPYEMPVTIGKRYGLLLAGCGLLLLLLVNPMNAELTWLNTIAELCVGPIMALLAVMLVIRSMRGVAQVIKLGRFTFAIMILVVGSLLVWDQLRERNDIAHIVSWWPVIVILLGAEIILFCLLLRHRAQKLKFDISGCLLALVVAVAAYGVTQYSDYPARWLDQFHVDLNRTADYSEEKGYNYEKVVMKVPLDEQMISLRIINVNGDVSVRSGDVQEIELRTVVWVDMDDKAIADSVAEQSMVKASPGPETVLEAKGKAYGANGSRLPRMNLDIIVPMSLSDQWYEQASDRVEAGDETGESEQFVDEAEFETNISEFETDTETETDTVDDRSPDAPDAEDTPDAPKQSDKAAEPENPKIALELKVDNGLVQVSRLAMLGGIAVESGNGIVEVSQIIGAVTVKGNNGDIELFDVAGDSSLETKQGSIFASSAAGALYASAMNGSLHLDHIEGDIDAVTRNGEITITEAMASVKADTLNGSVAVGSRIVGGSWDLDSSIGEVNLSLPAAGHYTVFGSVTFGDIVTDLPLAINRKTIRGTIGDGTFRISINATNSIRIKQIDS